MMEDAPTTPQRLVSYAQNLEDVMLYRALASVERGHYVDVGAAWPQYHSVTKLFYDRGWSGINLEPNPAFLAALVGERERDINLGIAAGERKETRRFTVVTDTGLSTLDHDRGELHRAEGWETEDIDVDVEPLGDVLRRHAADGWDIHFLKIDAEGAEGEVIAGMDWASYRPWIVVAEVGDTRHLISGPEWEPVLLDHGYAIAYDDGLNRFYVADEHADLIAAFTVPPNPWDDFVPVTIVELEIAREELFTSEANVRDLTWRLDKERERSDWIAREAEIKESDLRLRLEHSIREAEFKESDLRLRLDRSIAERDRAVTASRERERHLRLALAEARANATVERDRAAALEARIAPIADELEGLRRHAETITTSRSWTVTRPLRIAYSLRVAPGPGLRFIAFKLLRGRLGSERLIRPRPQASISPSPVVPAADVAVFFFDEASLSPIESDYAAILASFPTGATEVPA